MKVTLHRDDALLVVDVQRDFLPGGQLAVRGGDEVVPILNRYIALVQGKGMQIYASRDWHPANHCSFREHGGPWPPHCIATTPGAEFPADLKLPEDAIVISKATTAEADAYSAFGGTGLARRLRESGIHRVLVGGLTTDYCVVNTVRDVIKEHFAVLLLADAIRAVNVRPGDGEEALRVMREAGAVPVVLADIES